VDLEKFFDRVNHDILMDRLAKRIADKRVLQLIRRYLQAGILAHGVHSDRFEGTPQGSPLSPLLANVLLDEVDRELERRGHRFVRYADDCNVYVRSRKAGERVLQALRGCSAKLRLKVNESKTAVASVWGRKFLGYCFWAAPAGEVKRAVAQQALRKMRTRIRQLTRRTRGRSLEQVADDLRRYVRGWKAYFRMAQTPKLRREMDEWLRHRLRAIPLKQWRRGTTMFRELRKAGGAAGFGGTHRRQRPLLAAQQRHGPKPCDAHRLLRPSGSPAILLTSTSRTARCGPARRVVWEGQPLQERLPYPV
jgi:RNA-directed DNA polymerase